MGIVFLCVLVGTAVVSFIFSALSFLEKDDTILDHAYIKATKEEREGMDKKAYHRQAGVIFLLIGMMTLCNILRSLTHIAWFTCLAIGITIGGVVYTIVSHYTIKRKNKTESSEAMPVVQAPSTAAFSTAGIPPMEKPIGFAGNTAWQEEIHALETEEVYARYRDADGDWTEEYRYLCYEELTKR